MKHTKKCSKCKIEKEIALFNKDMRSSTGTSSHCKECKRTEERAFYLRNREKQIERSRVYYKENKSIHAARSARWKAANTQKINENKRNRYGADTIFAIKEALRSRLRLAIVNGHKSGSAIKDLGCSIEELKKYLESKFQEGMTWENWGKAGWHIDHIIPLSSFDLTDYDQLKRACHYTNLQPLWAKDNLRKSNKHPS